MKFRVISDLHIDINEHTPLEYDDDIFTVIAGDISGKGDWTKNWVDKNIKNGVFIEGNHIGYSDERTIDELNNFYSITYPISTDVSYLHNAFKEVEDVLFVGATLWTDFTLNTKGDKEKQLDNMFLGKRNMNDFRLNHVYKDGEYRELTPEDVLEYNRQSFNVLKGVVERNPLKKIVVVTHHAPTPESIGSDYVDNILNPCYANDLKDFILANPQIKVWIHGHIHSNSDYMVGTTRVICNPRGYEEFEVNPNWNKDLIIEV